MSTENIWAHTFPSPILGDLSQKGAYVSTANRALCLEAALLQKLACHFGQDMLATKRQHDPSLMCHLMSDYEL